MTLQAVYVTREEIPEKFRELYTEKDGQFELTGVEGIRTEADVERITAAYGKRIKDAAKGVKGSDSITAEDIQQIVADAIKKNTAPEPGKGDDKGGSDPAVMSRIEKLERDLAAATQQATEFKTQAEQATQSANETILTTQLSAAALASGLRPEAVDHFVQTHKGDFELQDGKLVRRFDESNPKTATETVESYLTAKKTDPKTSYFWPGNTGGGSGGSGKGGGIDMSDNPFDPKAPNLTKQNEIYRTDPEKAKALADQAGVDVLTGLPKK